MHDELDHHLQLDMKALAPREVEVRGVWERIQQETRGALRWRRARVGAVLLATLGLGLFGADRLVEALRTESYVVITGSSLPDDQKTSSAVPPATSMPGSGSATTSHTPEVQGYLDALRARWESRGIPVLSVDTTSPVPRDEALARANSASDAVLPLVCIRVPASWSDTYEGRLSVRDIERQAAFMARGGIPLRYLSVYTVNADGTDQLLSMGLVADLVPGPEWDAPATLDLEATRKAAQSLAQQEADQTSIPLSSLDLAEDDLGRTLTVGIVYQRGGSQGPATFFATLEVALRDMNKRGAKIATLVVKVYDPEGEPVAFYVMDYALANGVQSAWIAPAYKGQNALVPGWVG